MYCSSQTAAYYMCNLFVTLCALRHQIYAQIAPRATPAFRGTLVWASFFSRGDECLAVLLVACWCYLSCQTGIFSSRGFGATSPFLFLFYSCIFCRAPPAAAAAALAGTRSIGSGNYRVKEGLRNGGRRRVRYRSGAWGPRSGGD